MHSEFVKHEFLEVVIDKEEAIDVHVGHESLLDPPHVLPSLFQELQLLLVVTWRHTSLCVHANSRVYYQHSGQLQKNQMDIPLQQSSTILHRQ